MRTLAAPALAPVDSNVAQSGQGNQPPNNAGAKLQICHALIARELEPWVVQTTSAIPLLALPSPLAPDSLASRLSCHPRFAVPLTRFSHTDSVLYLAFLFFDSAGASSTINCRI